MKIIRRLLGYIWPEDNPGIRRRVVAAVSLLLSAKLANVAVPFIFKYGIDVLSGDAPILLASVSPTTMAVTTMLTCKLAHFFIVFTPEVFMRRKTELIPFFQNFKTGLFVPLRLV